MAGPGRHDLMQMLTPRTQQFSCLLAPYEHMMIPCAEFQAASETGGRGRLQLTPALMLPVENVPNETPLSAGQSQSSRTGGWPSKHRVDSSPRDVGGEPGWATLRRRRGPM